MKNIKISSIFSTLTSNKNCDQIKIVRGGIGVAITKISHMLLTFITSLILARNLGADGYGVYSFAFAVVMVFAIPAQLGIPQLVTRETANADAKNEFALMRGLWKWSLSAGLLFSFTIVLLIWFYLLYFDKYLEEQKRTTIILALWLIPLINLCSIQGAALSGLRHVVLGQVPQSILRPSLLIIFILFSLSMSTNFQLTPLSAMRFHVFSALAALIACTWLFLDFQPKISKSSYSKPLYRTRAWIRAIIPLALIGGLQLINNYTDIIMLGIMRSNEEVGIYRIVAQCGLIIAAVMQTVNMAIAPHIARLHSQSEIFQLQELITKCTRTVFIISLIVAIILIGWGKNILGYIFGYDFVSGYTALVILSTGLLIITVLGPVGLLLQMTGHEKDTVKGVAGAAALNLILNAILIPIMGINGAALSTVISLNVSHIILKYYVKARLNIDSSILPHISSIIK